MESIRLAWMTLRTGSQLVRRCKPATRRPTPKLTSAEALLERMLAKVDGLVEQRDRLKREAKLDGPTYPSGKRILGTPAHRRM